MATKLSDVLEFIRASMSRGDRDVIIDALNRQRKLADMQASCALHEGMPVEWSSSRLGGKKVTGVVKKVNRTTVDVIADETGTRWRVSPTMLRPRT